MPLIHRTNQESALSQKGIDQIEETCKRLKEAEVNPTIVRYSLAANSIGTSDIVGKDLKVSRYLMNVSFVWY